MAKITSHKKLLLIVGIIIIAANAIFLGFKYQVSLQPTFSESALKKQPIFQKHIDETVNRVELKAAELVSEGSFSTGASEEAQEIFENYFDQVKTADIFRIKVWDRNYTVVWSNATELIGKQYPDNHEVEEALEGEMEIEVKKGKSEHYTERSFSNFAEIYIPIKDSTGTIVGVIETYSVIEDVIQDLRTEFYKSVAISFGVSILLFGAVYLGLRYVKI